MKRWIIQYSLEIFTTFVLLFTVVNMLFFPDISLSRKLTNAFAVLAILHEFEEKRIPGGFHELMIKKFGLPKEQCDVDLAGAFVIVYWMVYLGLAYIFENADIFLIALAALGFFEAFVHTMGIWLHHMKKPYTPGLVSAWWMALLSLYTIFRLNANALATGKDYLIGTVLMFAGFAMLMRGTLYACKMTISNMKKNLQAIRKKP